MKKLIVPLACALLLLSCSNAEKAPESTSIDIAREFIRASLNGDFAHAAKYLSSNPQNADYFKAYEAMYQKMPEAERKGYKDASIDINAIQDVSDSVSIIKFSNSYKKQPMELKLVREQNHWVVDFQHSYRP